MKIYDTLDDLRIESLLADDFVKLRGNTTAYDGEDREFFILTPAQHGGVPDEVHDITLANGNIAKLVAASTVDIVRPQSVLVASSLTDQTPVGTDSILQIEFGPAQFTPSDPVQILANGDIVINTAGAYELLLFLSVSRPNSPGVARVFMRLTVNGSQAGIPAAVEMTDDDMTLLTSISLINTFAAGDVIRAEMSRDSSGNNDGGLVSFTSSIGWGASPSAALRMFKFG